MTERLQQSLEKKRTLDIIEVILFLAAFAGLALSVLRPDGCTILSVSCGRYDIFYFAVVALVSYVLVMKVTEK